MENNKLNLVEILKGAPKGTELYSPIFGECEFVEIRDSCQDYPIVVKALQSNNEGCEFTFTASGTLYKEFKDAECLLFPSKDNRDWSTFKVGPQFPMTYKDCCELISAYFNSIVQVGDRYSEQLNTLRKLLICRDAWWKVDDNWKPDWSKFDEKYTIVSNDNKINVDGQYIDYNTNHILAFRTKEIRDKFFETFRDFIEDCKELI